MFSERVRISAGFIIFLSVLLFLPSCGPAGERGDLTIYAGVYEDQAIRAMEVFQKESGIKVSFVRMSGGEILSRIREEKDNPRASVWFGGPADTFVQAKLEGLLEPYISGNASQIEDKFKDPEGYWTGIYVGTIAFVSNKSWLNRIGLEAPTSWKDLLDPKNRGRLTMPDPRSSATGYTVLSTLVQLWGENEAFAYFKKLKEQGITFTSSGSTPGRSVGMGEAGTAIMFSHDAQKFYKEGFRELFISQPAEGTGYEVGAVGIIANSPNQKEARLFVDWVLTKQAQELGKQTGNLQMLTNRNAVSPEEAPHLPQQEELLYRFDWAGMNRQRLLDRWTREIEQGFSL
jgi:iron(III) transport system substrate-binding protein